MFPSGGSRGNPFPCLFELLKAAHVPGLTAPSLYCPSQQCCICRKRTGEAEFCAFGNVGGEPALCKVTRLWGSLPLRGGLLLKVWVACVFRNNSPFTNGSPRPGRLTWFMDTGGIEEGLSGTKSAAADVLYLKECFFSAELPVNNRHSFFGIPVRDFLWECILSSAYFCLFCSPPHFELLLNSTLIPKRYPKMSLERNL